MARKIKIKTKRKSSDRRHFDEIHTGILDVAESLEKGKKLTRRTVTIPDPPELLARDIIAFRQKKLKVSQHVFAYLLNVKTQTVQAWEQQRNKPAGATLRLLQLAQKNPNILLKLLAN